MIDEFRSLFTMQLHSGKPGLFGDGPHPRRSLVLKDSNAFYMGRQPRNDGLGLLRHDPSLAGREHKSHRIGPRFNGSESIFKAGSSAEFDPGFHLVGGY